ncbi:amidohydrolase family protein [Cellulosilyticum ruminicola]|uniref:amidohydrolase family protein n=1 Tax=Cellulosilyticum ruminicola TaxID=425254 RepID=UPI0006D271BA|nr:amidohydrolase family protein [Cellulosilyticum ruminicola]
MITNKQSNFILKGQIIYSKPDWSVSYNENAYIVCEEGKVEGVYENLPDAFKAYPIIDCKEQLIIPGMSDLHVHAPQYPFRGLGMDLELLEWLNNHTFPEEAKYQDITYAHKAYSIFVDDLLYSTTTRACIFATIHPEATLDLMSQLEASGLYTYVGKVNMDRNGSPRLQEESAAASYKATREWIISANKSFKHTLPMLTPRFIPTCSDELMNKLHTLQTEFNLPLQSHLSENLSEINWVKQLVPTSKFYGDAYHQFGLFGGEVPTVMAHCIYSPEEEIKLMKQNNVYIAHCPESNTNLSSGIAPIRKYMEEGLNIGLGSDVAAGTGLSLLKSMAMAIQVSKLYYCLVDQDKKPLTTEEVFYLATLGGGSFFGKVGSFMPGYAFDVVVIDDSAIKAPRSLSLKERLERILYYSDQVQITEKYVDGQKLKIASK